ncbi:MAG: tetratricopeptide repeat protein [Flavobacteriales bacterium]|nr:tetratricopeptide repeat protein [Flavobacteriales bacterium]
MWPAHAAAQADVDASFRSYLDSAGSAENAGDYERANALLDHANDIALAARDVRKQARVIIRRGVITQRRGDFNKALMEFYAAMRLCEANDDQAGLAEVYNNIGSIHHYDKNFDKAGHYYALSMEIRDRTGTPFERAQLYNNFGALLEDRGRLDSALILYRRGLAIRLSQKDTSWIAVTYSHIGECLDKLGRLDSARHYLLESHRLIARTPNRFVRGNVNVQLGMNMLHSGNAASAIQYCSVALATARELRTLGLEQQACECLFQAYESAKRPFDALAMLQRYVVLRDSMFGQQLAKEITRVEMTHSFEREQLADSLVRVQEKREADIAYQERLSRERDQKRVFLFGVIAVTMLAVGLWSRLRYMRRSRNAIDHERQRSDKLLLNILPRTIAEELKQFGEAKARDVAGVSILFTDFEDFTPQSERMSAHELVAAINTCFKAFDAIVTRYGLEKIKTIGDAYMCAGGLPEPRTGSTRDTVLAALEMQAYMRMHAAERHAQGLPAFSMRAGIHTGPVVAGIVGDTKFQYDLWGDTVNIAARMESTGEVGRVNISEGTYELVKREPGLRFTVRGMVQVKGKGDMEMYYVERE